MAASKTNNETRFTGVKLPVELHERLREMKHVHRLMGKDIIIRAITQEVERLEREARKQGTA